MVVFTQGIPHYSTFVLEIPWKIEGKRPLGNPSVDGEIILKWIYRKWGGGAWTELV